MKSNYVIISKSIFISEICIFICGSPKFCISLWVPKIILTWARSLIYYDLLTYNLSNVCSLNLTRLELIIFINLSTFGLVWLIFFHYSILSFHLVTALRICPNDKVLVAIFTLSWRRIYLLNIVQITWLSILLLRKSVL